MNANGSIPKPTQATLLVDLAEAGELFHTPDGDPYATMPVDDHRETWAVHSRGFRQWLGQRFYREHDRAASGPALTDALTIIEGRACFGGPVHEVHVRIAGHDGGLHLDLADAAWQAVEITANGWHVVDDPPVRFRRPRGVMPLPEPVAGGSLTELRRFVNVGSDSDFCLITSWLISACRDRGPFPVLMLAGEQGAAKSTTARVLRQLVDPNKADLRAEPRDVRDLMIAADNSWITTLENMSALPLWLSDGLCRLSSGAGFAVRENYADRDEIIFECARPILVNGIEDVVTRGDLLDRTIRLTLPSIRDIDRRDEQDFWSDFEQARPRILGAIMDALSAALRNIDGTTLDRAPRMADFARWVVAAELSLPWPLGTFLEVYAENRGSAHEVVLEDSPVACVLLGWYKEKYLGAGWTGTATGLLDELTAFAGYGSGKRPPKGWPGKPNILSGHLRRIAPTLRANGVEVVRGERQSGTGRRLVTVQAMKGGTA